MGNNLIRIGQSFIFITFGGYVYTGQPDLDVPNCLGSGDLVFKPAYHGHPPSMMCLTHLGFNIHDEGAIFNQPLLFTGVTICINLYQKQRPRAQIDQIALDNRN